MKKLIKMYNEKYGNTLGVIDDDFNKEQMYRIYYFIKNNCDDEEIQARLEKIKLDKPKTLEQQLTKLESEHNKVSGEVVDPTIKNDINNIKTDLGTSELNTTAKDIKGAINEVNAQYKDIVNNFKLVSGDNNTIKLMFGTKELSSITINGGTVKPTPNTYTITNTLSNATNSNTATSVEEGSSYSANISANSGYKLKTVTVTMGGTDITNSAYLNGAITISSVTGNIVIIVTTETDIDVVVGNIDSNNNISLTGLSTGTYTLKYEDDNGELSNYDTITTMEVN